MDTITHVLLGAVAARATAKQTSDQYLPTRMRTLVGGLAAAFPDIDYITICINPLSFIADWHRAITHSFVMLPIWALALGFLFATLSKRKTQWREFVLVCGIGIFTHIIADLITSWGTQIFAPLSQFAPALSFTFVIDPYFTAIVAIALAISLFKQSRLIARMGLVVLASYLAMQAILKQQAVTVGNEFARSNQLHSADVFAMPQPFSPFNWKLIVTKDNQYYMAYVNLLARKASTSSPTHTSNVWDIPRYYRASHDLLWKRHSLYDMETVAETVWAHPEFERFRRFARYPALYRIDKSESNHCVWFMDLRFALPNQLPPFRYGMCKQAEADWTLYRLAGVTKVMVGP